jgi:hypothetical protein
MSYTIITHAGKAHADELLASALLRLHKGEPPLSVERIFSEEAARRIREGQTGEGLYYLDCGLAYDPARNLFDHHHDRELPSSAFLVLEEFFPGLKGTELHDYIRLVSKVDNEGPKSLNDFESLDESRFYFTMSNKLMLKAFESQPAALIELFAASLEDNMAFEKQKALAREWIEEEENVSLRMVHGCLVLRFNKRPPEELIVPIRAVDDEIVDTHNVEVVYSFDDRDERARSLFRTFHGHEKVDFTLCRPENPQFCHQNGFLMKFIPASEEEWKDLVEQSAGARE